MSKKVLVIGAGLGGMSAAISLAQKGFKVTLVEKNDHLGGKLNQLKQDGFSFDLGPSIFSLPQMFRPLFEENGKKMEDYIPLRRLDPQWRNFFEDQTVFDLWEDLEKMKGELTRIKADSFEDYQNFLEYSKTQYHLVNEGYFEKGLDTFWEFFKHYGFFGASKLDYLTTMSKGISNRIESPYLRAMFEYFIKYVGSSANDAPGFMNLMPNIQLEFGLWYVDGGMYEVAKAFEKRLSELGVMVLLDTEVVRIETAGKTAKGAVLKNSRGTTLLESDYVVSNMEVIPAHEKLLNADSRTLKKLSRFEPACSGIVLHLGVKKRYPELAHHNFFYSKNQTKHFDRVFKEKKLPDDPTLYVVCPSRTDPTQAPEGCENIKILPHIPYLQTGKEAYTYEDCVWLKERVIDKLERMGLKDLRKNIIVEDFWTPFDIEKKYYSNRGSIYGVVTDRRKNFAFKAPKKSTHYQNLFFVGGSVNPGGGMPMVVLSGRKVAEMISKEAKDVAQV